ncbi:hypothetical protein DEO72_LG11g1835 [Vigna unguiculata]|uniref:Uncharacterized protein n=1 Tax=Vigna unguiculata TaxID=3917 RepID=A0A4D6NQN7_VIGUN|nr:hypothetical protein DEO72_LG11g1835 [Vigna unguiculata]
MYTDAPRGRPIIFPPHGHYHVPCCHTYRPQPIEHVRKLSYGSHTITPGGVPKYEHSPHRSRTTKLVSDSLRRAIHLDPSVPNSNLFLFSHHHDSNPCVHSLAATTTSAGGFIGDTITLHSISRKTLSHLRLLLLLRRVQESGGFLLARPHDSADPLTVARRRRPLQRPLIPNPRTFSSAREKGVIASTIRHHRASHTATRSANVTRPHFSVRSSDSPATYLGVNDWGRRESLCAIRDLTG